MMRPPSGDTGLAQNMSTSETETVTSFIVAPSDGGERVDHLVGEYVPETSRSAAARLIRGGNVTVDGVPVLKPSHKCDGGARVEVRLPPPDSSGVEPQNLPIRIVFEDDDIAVIDKEVGMVVHPAAGHRDGTLVNALLHHLEGLSGVGGEARPGIVHRLDKETSGLLVVAKHDRAHRTLTATWNSDAVRKFYLALVYGTPSPEDGTIDRPIGRDPRDRKRMAVVPSGRSAVTLYRVLEAFPGCALLELELRTGRTHQIRVHLKSIGHPVVGDTVYGGAQWKGVRDPNVQRQLRTMKRQALHAARLEMIHPITGAPMTVESPLPEDMQKVLEGLRGNQ